MIEGFSLGSYLLLVDYTGRLFRDGKAMISQGIAGIFERLGTDADTWQARMQKLNGGRLLGRFFAASRERLREVSKRLGLRRAVNLGGLLLTEGWHEASRQPMIRTRSAIPCADRASAGSSGPGFRDVICARPRAGAATQ